MIERRRVPVGTTAQRWRTLHQLRTVLAAARTLTSAIRLLDALECFRADPRVQVVFTVDTTSAFSTGAAALLEREGAALLPWDQAAETPVDLVVTASENLDFGAFDAPAVVLPHGVGFHKYVPDSRSADRRLSGLVAEEHLAAKRIVLAVSHPEQEAQLAAASPHTAGATACVGDLAYDGLLAGAPLRGHYRDRLGAGDDRRLVLVSSTWGPESLFGQRPGIAAELLAELPADRYRVAAALHPNVWSLHSPWQVRAWLAQAREAGLLLLPSERGWQAALVAADCVIGDHGSVTFYAAALDRPVLLGAFGAEAVPGTPMAEFAESAPRLGGPGRLCGEVEAAIADHTPGRYAQQAERALSRPGEAFTALRGLFYELLGLPVPDTPPVLRAPAAPDSEHTPALSFETHTECPEPGLIAVRRYPAGVRSAAQCPPGAMRHLSAATTEPDQRLAQSASVVYRPEPAGSGPEAAARAAEALAAYPGALLAAAAGPDGCTVALRTGGVLQVTGEDGPPQAPAAVLAAAVYTLLRTSGGQTPGPGILRIRAGTREHRVVLHPVARGPTGLAGPAGSPDPQAADQPGTTNSTTGDPPA
ncbi:hypothetical protein GCM10027570_38320 [Streptomonospora sediminis]